MQIEEEFINSEKANGAEYWCVNERNLGQRKKHQGFEPDLVFVNNVVGSWFSDLDWSIRENTLIYQVLAHQSKTWPTNEWISSKTARQVQIDQEVELNNASWLWSYALQSLR